MRTITGWQPRPSSLFYTALCLCQYPQKSTDGLDGGPLIVAYLLVGVASGQDWTSYDESIAQKTHKKPDPKAPPPDKEAEAVFWTKWGGSPDTYRAICENPTDNTQANLCLQWRATKAAEQSADWVFPQFVASILGIVGLSGTIWLSVRSANAAIRAAKATESSVGIAGMTAERQLRAYVSITLGKVTIPPNLEGKIEVSIEVANHGQTPAFQTTMFTIFRDCVHPLRRRVFEDRSTKEPYSIITIFPGAKSHMHSTSGDGEQFTSDQIDRWMASDTNRLHVIFMVKYRDAFEQDRWTEVAVNINGGNLARMMSGGEFRNIDWEYAPHHNTAT